MLKNYFKMFIDKETSTNDSRCNCPSSGKNSVSDMLIHPVHSLLMPDLDSNRKNEMHSNGTTKG